ncbi:MAG: signal peptidase I [Coriobacteriia bacterium]|nr:signal peptidase I [Coriobacteriia bacterium]
MPVFGPAGSGDRLARRLLVPLTVLLAVLVLVFWVLFSPIKISGDSMLPGLHHGDRVLVTRGYGTLSRGDVVYMDASALRLGHGGQVVKRVAALPGDTILVRRGRAVVNGVPENDDIPVRLSEDDVSVAEITVPADHVYVLGDNRPNSFDSRFYGPVPLSAVHGRLVFRYTPVTRLGTVD